MIEAKGPWRTTLTCAAFAVLALGATQTYGLAKAPSLGATPAEVSRFLVDHRQALRWSVWAATAGAVASATLLALLGDTLPRPFRTLYLLGGVVVIASSMCQAWFWGGLTVRPEATPPEVARALVDVAAYFGPVLTGAMITMIAPVTLLALKRASGLPRWLGLFGAVVVLEQALETVTVFGHAGFTAPGGGMNMQLGAALVTGWSLAFAACRILGERETS